MSISPFDIIRHISEKTPLEFEKNEYVPFVINRGLSNMIDTLFFAEVMNKYHHLNGDIQYKFYLHGIPKGKRYGKWIKPLELNTTVELIMSRYQVGRRAAESYFKLMDESAIKLLEEEMIQGGRK